MFENFTKDRKVGFSNSGFQVARNNPDGTVATPDSTKTSLLEGGAFDAGALLATDVLSYRIGGSGAFTDVIVNLTTADTVADVKTALDTALTGVFTSEYQSGYLTLAATGTGITELEVTGAVAVALGIGGGLGTAYYDVFQRAGAYSLPKNVVDAEDVDQESSTGHIDTMKIDAKHKGINPSIAVVEEDYALKVIIQGGSWDAALSKYVPPTSEDVLPVCRARLFEAKYPHGVNRRTTPDGYKMTVVYSMSGREADLSTEVKAWNASYAFDCSGVEWRDSTGTLRSAYEDYEITVAQARAIGVTH